MLPSVYPCTEFLLREKARSPQEFSASSSMQPEPRYNEPLNNKVLDITNDFLYPSNSKIYVKEPR